MDVPSKIKAEWIEYNRLRSSGLKKHANKVLMSIVQTMEQDGVDEYREFLYALCDESIKPRLYNEIQYPIFYRCALPLLVRGYELKSVRETLLLVKANLYGYSQEVYSAIGDVSNTQLLKMVLAAQPFDQEAIQLLAEEYVNYLDFGAHHIPECLVVELSEAKSVIEESLPYVDEYREHIDPQTLQRHQYYVELYRDYEAWESSESGDNFREWCEQRKKVYVWSRYA